MIIPMNDETKETTKNSDNDNDSWKSCCLRTDRQMVVYIGQILFSFAVLSFSGVMLYVADGSCEKSSPYIGLISFLLGKILSSVTDSTHR